MNLFTSGANKSNNLLKWIGLSVVVGITVGSASAWFLILLEHATSFREANKEIIWGLPIAGLIIGLGYHYFGKEIVKGNNLILEEYYHPNKIIKILMAPMVFAATILTHLFGGSAGREGTAVQMGGAIADQLTTPFKLSNDERKIILLVGISAGFSSVFGTPLTGVVFAVELVILGSIAYKAIIPCFISAIIAHYVCLAWGATHTIYTVNPIEAFHLNFMAWSVVAGILFGITAMLFTNSTSWWSQLFSKLFQYSPIRPLVAGIIIAIAVYIMGTTKYIGLGIPTIVQSFQTELLPFDFLIKILFTSFTLGAGFKGGEVTPLFYIGATLGNALVWFIPLPMDMLAAMGFVAVFSGATKTPIACTIMGYELFGLHGLVYIAIACTVAYLFSGKKGIYASQVTPNNKYSYLIVKSKD